MFQCQVCRNTDNNRLHRAREMMFGFRDEFDYRECLGCGCLQITPAPADLEKYYPEEYYSFAPRTPRRKGSLQSFFKRKRGEFHLSGRGWLGWMVSRLEGRRDYFDWLRRAGVKFDSKILDVGCGSGQLLLKWNALGFKRLVGIDLFIENDIDYGPEVRILKKDLADVDERFDFILLNHSFEHMPDPWESFHNLARILKPGRYALIRTPQAASYAWRHYGSNWVQLDPPRHLFVHTRRSIEILADGVGLRLTEVIHDSTEFQFVGSELYNRDIALQEPGSFYVNRRAAPFTRRQIRAFRRHASELNRRNEGDQACFYIFKG